MVEDPLLLRDLIVRLLIAMGAGLLIGLEREYAKRVRENDQQFAGVRTHTLIALTGFMAAWLAQQYGAWVFVVSLIGVLALVLVSYYLIARNGNYGGTSEISSVITFLIGATVLSGEILFAMTLTVLVLLLLSLKIPLHRFAGTLDPQEIRAFAQFIIISVLVVPFLPNEDFGPYEVWNLKEIWMMVVLVSGISLVGYLLMKILDRRRGALWTALLGGLVSSTAIALNFSRRSKEEGESSGTTLGMGVLAACTMMFPRVALIVGFIRVETALALLLPVSLLALVGFLMIAYLRKRNGHPEAEDLRTSPVGNPLNLRVALQFALLYAGVKWLVAYADADHGIEGMYLAATVSGLTDVDAISISLAQQSKDSVQIGIARNVILVAMLSNTMVKFLIVLISGSTTLRKAVLPGFLALIGTGMVWLLGSVLF